MNPSSTGRNAGLDTLRALAIVLVFTNHYMLFVSGGPTFGWFSEVGWTGVDLFFALSGYLIGNQILGGIRRQQGAGGERFSLARFYARRLLRTLPNFYVVLALYALWPYFRGNLVLPPLWKFLTFTQNIALVPGTAFSHAWSLCVEEQFYFLLPAVALAIAACRPPVAAAGVADGGRRAAGRHGDTQLYLDPHVGPAEQGGFNYYTLIYYSSLCRFDELVAGVALALLKNYHAGVWARITLVRQPDAGRRRGAAGANLDAVPRRPLRLRDDGCRLSAAGSEFHAVAGGGAQPGFTAAAGAGAGRGRVALWSYAIYLTHKTLCVLLRAPLQDAGWGPDTWQAIVLMSAASMLAGWLLHLLVETPFMKLRDRFVPGNFSRPAAPAGAVA